MARVYRPPLKATLTALFNPRDHLLDLPEPMIIADRQLGRRSNSRTPTRRTSSSLRRVSDRILAWPTYLVDDSVLTGALTSALGPTSLVVAESTVSFCPWSGGGAIEVSVPVEAVPDVSVALVPPESAGLAHPLNTITRANKATDSAGAAFRIISAVSPDVRVSQCVTPPS